MMRISKVDLVGKVGPVCTYTVTITTTKNLNGGQVVYVPIVDYLRDRGFEDDGPDGRMKTRRRLIGVIEAGMGADAIRSLRAVPRTMGHRAFTFAVQMGSYSQDLCIECGPSTEPFQFTIATSEATELNV